MQSQQTGIPNQPTGKAQQDDIMVKIRRRYGKPIPPEWNPNCVVRVSCRPLTSGKTAAVPALVSAPTAGARNRGKFKQEQYWPGLFINFRSATDRRFSQDSAYLTIRADQRGRDIRGPEITPGWWTMGMSVSGDGTCHFYARQGIEICGPKIG